MKSSCLKKKEIEAKDKEIATLKRQLSSKTSQEVVESKTSLDNDDWVDDVAKGTMKLTVGVAKGIGNAAAGTAKALYSGFSAIKSLFS